MGGGVDFFTRKKAAKSRIDMCKKGGAAAICKRVSRRNWLVLAK
jgi:hypothetical protein